MPKKNPFFKQYPIGCKVWHLVSQSKGAWRVGIVTNHYENNSWASISVVQPGTKTKREIAEAYDSQVFPYERLAYVPNGTTYLINTQIGHTLSHRLGEGWNTRFEVYECGNRMVTKGTHFGYLIIPGYIGDCIDQYKDPAYKVWHVAPNVQELLSFLGAKLPEILAVNKALNPEEKQNGTIGSSEQPESEVQEVGE
jgi:hypothetical protein